jgi:hypothetical protein
LDGLVDHGPSAEATRDVEGGGVGEPICCLRCSLAIVVSVSTPRGSNIAGPPDGAGRGPLYPAGSVLVHAREDDL